MKTNINNRIIFSYIIVKLIKWLLLEKKTIKNKSKKQIKIEKKEIEEKLIKWLQLESNKKPENTNKEIEEKLIKWLQLEKKEKLIKWLLEKKEKLIKLLEKKNLKNSNKKPFEKVEELEKKVEMAIKNIKKDEINIMVKMLEDIKKILGFKAGIIDRIISKFKIFSYINSQISNSSLLISFNYLVKYNLNINYLEKLGWLTQIGRDRLYPAKWLGKSLLWEKLSNSGNFLKFMIPSYILNFISGWINYLGMVISHKMIEREIEYRGSKSE